MPRVRFASNTHIPPSPIAPPGIPKNLVGTIYVSSSVPVANTITATNSNVTFNFPGEPSETISYDRLKTGYYLFPEITNESAVQIKRVIDNQKCRLIEKIPGVSYAKVIHVGNEDNRTITTQLKTYTGNNEETTEEKEIVELTDDFIPIYSPEPEIGSKKTSKKKKKPKKKK